MFAIAGNLAAFQPQASADGTPRKIQPPTPVRFPKCTPQAEDTLPSSFWGDKPLVALLQTIYRPGDIQLSHFQALGLHVICDATPQDILPDASFLPPFEKWREIGPEKLDEATRDSKKPLNNGSLSPGVQTYQERRKELSIDNTAAFRTIRRIPVPPGETSVRLGNAYEFFKNLELFSGYWLDTSLPQSASSPEGTSSTPEKNDAEKEKDKEKNPAIPIHLQTHYRTGTGSQLPQEYRQNLLTAFIKLVAYDFGCNVSFPRCEPRLFLTPPSTPTPSKPPSYFNSSVSFIYRTPKDRSSARSGIQEGPVATVSCRTSTVFATEHEERLDLAREVVGILLTAQQRARDGKTEKRSGDGKWWTSKPRWGGGPGGPIGREGDKVEEPIATIGSAEGEKLVTGGMNDVKRAIGGINGPSPSKRSKKSSSLKEGNLQIYENYRKMLPPSSTWDRKARYCAIGKVEGAGYDDIFLVSALNHHVSIVRARVPENLLRILEGGDQAEGWEKVTMWRSKWFDLFLASERIEGMELVWGMMAWLMRSQTVPENQSEVMEGDKMDTT